MRVAGINSPASATNVGSSKVTAIRSMLRDDELTGSASWSGGISDFDITILPGREALSADAALAIRRSSVDRG